VAGGGAAFVALAVASLVVYLAVRSNPQGQIDAALIQVAEGVASKWNVENTLHPGSAPSGPPAGPRTSAPPPAGQPISGSDASGYLQLIPDLTAATRGALPAPPQGEGPLAQNLDGFVPATGLDESVARGVAPPYFRDVRYRGVEMRLSRCRCPSAKDGLIRTAPRWGARGGSAGTTDREYRAAPDPGTGRHGARGERDA
jgi:hypothetical protein